MAGKLDKNVYWSEGRKKTKEGRQVGSNIQNWHIQYVERLRSESETRMANGSVEGLVDWYENANKRSLQTLSRRSQDESTKGNK